MRKWIQLAELPFYTQRMTAENWQAEGFPSLAEAENWSGRGCGIASLRMVLEGFGCACGGQGKMISKGLAAGAYKEGVGWIHGKLAEMAGNYGVFGEAKRGKALADLQKDLEKGFVDIVIGTHRVLSADVKFKDLGLLIIDEEQRFGVAHKEKIKKLKENGR